VSGILKDKPCVPTRQGLKRPVRVASCSADYENKDRADGRKQDAAYSTNVKLFEDLPVVAMPSGAAVHGALERLMYDLGLRRHVEVGDYLYCCHRERLSSDVDCVQLSLVFARMLAGGAWSHVDLTRYLVSVKDMLTEVELDRLKETRWLPREGEEPSERGGKTRVVRYVLGLLTPK
jgi:hypothetical protein